VLDDTHQNDRDDAVESKKKPALKRERVTRREKTCEAMKPDEQATHR
jgi:hypothetical protein